jgi:hypothetical protein
LKIGEPCRHVGIACDVWVVVLKWNMICLTYSKQSDTCK